MRLAPEMRQLRLRQLDGQLRRVRESVPAKPSEGWVRTIRQALAMTTTQLARRLGISQPGVVRLEKSEEAGSITLKSLREIAEALECDLVYALVPRDSLQNMVVRQARLVAERRMGRVSHTMRLEDQETTETDLAAQTDQLAARLAQDLSRRIWD